MQCCEGLPETGIADEATWARLLGPSLDPKPSRDLTADMMLNVPGLSALAGKAAPPDGPGAGSAAGAATAQQQQEQPVAKPYAELFNAALGETVRPVPAGGVEDAQRPTVTDTASGGLQGCAQCGPAGNTLGGRWEAACDMSSCVAVSSLNRILLAAARLQREARW